MSMYRVMQNPDTPDLPFAQSTMELATLTRSSNPTALTIHRPIPKSDISKRAFKPSTSTGLLALAGVLLLA